MCENDEEDGIIYCYKPSLILIPANVSPSDYSKVCLLKPKGIVPRITRQAGVFTVHGQPNKPLNDALWPEDILDSFVVRGKSKRQILFDLNHYGVNSMTIFPDLDGLSAHVNWYTQNADYWDGKLEDLGKLSEV